MSLSPPPNEFPSILPPAPFIHTEPPPALVVQGAEALLYRTHFLLPSHPCCLKYRPPKPYRHPTLDARLTRHRILSEARILVKCRREGISVPAVLALDWECEGGGGWMLIEWVEGRTVKEVLIQSKGIQEGNTSWEEWLRGLMGAIGRAVGKMHQVGIVHGDLTTSNILARNKMSKERKILTNGGYSESVGSLKEVSEQYEELENGGVVLIDFGLAAQSSQEEDRAVDLYVLERAFGSTHPEAEEEFKEVLSAYAESYKGAKVVLKRLEDVRMRGRKRSMLG